MYCKNCGKFIGNDADLCDECLAKKEAFNAFSEGKAADVQPTEYQPSACGGRPANDASRQIKLGKAIAAMILSEIGAMLIYIGIFMLARISIIIGCIPSVLGLIFGIQSIACFKATSRIKNGKRIPVLILGISSVAITGTMLLLAVFFAFLFPMLFAVI